jgi:hypothetical protein
MKRPKGIFPWQVPWEHLEQEEHVELAMLRWLVKAQVAQGELLIEILEGQERIMADLTVLQAELADAKASADAALEAVEQVLLSVADLKAANADLKAQLDLLTAGAVTQAQIDELTATATTIDDTVDAIVVAATPTPVA